MSQMLIKAASEYLLFWVVNSNVIAVKRQISIENNLLDFFSGDHQFALSLLQTTYQLYEQISLSGKIMHLFKKE